MERIQFAHSLSLRIANGMDSSELAVHNAVIDRLNDQAVADGDRLRYVPDFGPGPDEATEGMIRNCPKNVAKSRAQAARHRLVVGAGLLQATRGDQTGGVGLGGRVVGRSTLGPDALDELFPTPA